MSAITKLTFIAAATLVTTGLASAQPAPPPPPGGGTPGGAAVTGAPGTSNIGVDGMGILPLGDYSNGASFGIGVLGRFEYNVDELITATGRLGYVYHLGTPANTSISFIPILVGGTYKIGPSGLFAFGEIGITNISASVDVMGMTASNSTTKFSFTAGVGYRQDKLSARLGMYMPGSEDNGNGGSSTLFGIMGSVGMDIVAL